MAPPKKQLRIRGKMTSLRGVSMTHLSRVWTHASFSEQIVPVICPSPESRCVNCESLASVAESGRDMLSCPNLRSFFLRAASATANLMDVDPGINENTSRPSFRVSEGSYNTTRVAAVHGPVTKLPRVSPGAIRWASQAASFTLVLRPARS
jgi:hypothetical protein